MYQIETPSGKVIDPPGGRCWKNLESVYKQMRAENRLWFGESGDGVPRQKNYLADRAGKTAWTWWPNTEVGHTQEATQELAELLGKAKFDYPKPVRLIERVLELATSKESIVLDSFAGSATTAHAVLRLNQRDGGHRRFILVELSDYADTVTAERVRRVIAGYGKGDKTTPGIDSGFSYYELGPVLFEPDGMLNPDVPREELFRYVWYTETKADYVDMTDEHRYLLGEIADTVYYLAYDGAEESVLGYDLLRTLPRRGSTTVIYADRCVLPQDRLDALNIVFKQIPRQIARM